MEGSQEFALEHSFLGRWIVQCDYYPLGEKYQGTAVVYYNGFWKVAHTGMRASTMFNTGYRARDNERISESQRYITWGEHTTNGRKYAVNKISDKNIEQLDESPPYEGELQVNGRNLSMELLSKGTATCRVFMEKTNIVQFDEDTCEYSSGTPAVHNSTHVVVRTKGLCKIHYLLCILKLT